ncbi:uncharacterized protein [Pyxicephalus adspersus]|uniref:uncharacterized protein n=1 Tax=Pyxicephalus adspersus TaxID=30357 RepID=UPI003B5BB6EA
MSSMDQPPKHRPKSAPVITNAYVQNKKEDECLCEKLDSIHYQHYADLIKLKQAVGHIVRQRRVLLTQRAITPQSTLDHVLDEIHTYKKYKQGSGLSRSYLPASTELYVDNGTSSKWSPPPTAPSLPIVYKPGDVKMFPFAGRMLPVVENTEMKSTEMTVRHQQSLEKQSRRPRATTPLERRPHSSMDLMTYKQLSEISRLEKISVREAERQRQQLQLEKQNMNKLHDNALQEKVHTFLKKLE